MLRPPLRLSLILSSAFLVLTATEAIAGMPSPPFLRAIFPSGWIDKDRVGPVAVTHDGLIVSLESYSTMILHWHDLHGELVRTTELSSVLLDAERIAASENGNVYIAGFHPGDEHGSGYRVIEVLPDGSYSVLISDLGIIIGLMPAGPDRLYVSHQGSRRVRSYRTDGTLEHEFLLPHGDLYAGFHDGTLCVVHDYPCVPSWDNDCGMFDWVATFYFHGPDGAVQREFDVILEADSFETISTRGSLIAVSFDDGREVLVLSGEGLEITRLRSDQDGYYPDYAWNAHILPDRRIVLPGYWSASDESQAGYGASIYDPFPTGIVIDSHPSGLQVQVDGASYVTPVGLVSTPGSVHEVSTQYIQEDPGQTRDRFAEWSGRSGSSVQVTVGQWPETAHATFEREVFLSVDASPGGAVSPASGYYPLGSEIRIEAIEDGRFTFSNWVGNAANECCDADHWYGDQCCVAGSYTGTEPTASFILQAPTTQFAQFWDQGYEFLLSASPSDPYVQSAAPMPGQLRQIHLWGTCLRRGLSALEASITGSMNVIGFEPAPGVLNVYDGRNLLLAIGGCPMGDGVNFRLGHFLILGEEGGGDICLGPSIVSGERLVADCDQFNPAAWDFVVRGFSSTGDNPCVIGANGCTDDDATSPLVSNLRTTPGLRRVNLEWSASSSEIAAFHVYRGPVDGVRQRLTSVAIEGSGDLAFTDSDVVELTTYHYFLEVVSDGETEMLGPVTVTTPRFPRLTATDFEIGPNPFRGQVTFSFSLPQEDRVRVAIYDVTGRLVRDLADEALPAGRHSLRWDGRSGDGAPVPAGVYFSRAEFGPQRETRRLVYLGGR